MARRAITCDSLRDGIYYYSQLAQARGVANLCSGAWTEHSPLTPQSVQGQDLSGLTAYPAPNGAPRLRQTVADAYADAKFGPRNVTITPGATGALLIAMSISANAGDEIIFPTPAYPVTASAAQLAGMTPRPAPAWIAPAGGAGWHLDIERLERAITPATAVIAVADPDNPTGAVLEERSWRALIALADKHGLQLIVDRTYETYTYGRSLLSARTLLDAGALVASSISKSYHSAGLRIGWLLAPESAESALGEAVIAYFGGVALIGQVIAAGAIAASTPADLEAERKAAGVLRDVLIKRLANAGVEAWPVEGGLFVNTPAAALGAASAHAAWERLIERGLGGVPSSEFVFGGNDRDPFVRFSFARNARVLMGEVHSFRKRSIKRSAT